jgi:hypothetical protein
VAALVAQGVKPVRIVYQDGGQNAAFAGKDEDASAPEALAAGPTEITLDNSGKPLPPAKVVVAAAPAKPVVAPAPVAAPAPAATPAQSSSPFGFLNGAKSFFGLGGAPAAPQASATD